MVPVRPVSYNMWLGADYMKAAKPGRETLSKARSSGAKTLAWRRWIYRKLNTYATMGLHNSAESQCRSEVYEEYPARIYAGNGALKMTNFIQPTNGMLYGK